MNKLLTPPYTQPTHQSKARKYVLAYTQFSFYLFLILLLLSSPSVANPGPLGWWPNPLLLTRYGWPIGPLASLPLLILGGWAYNWRTTPFKQRRSWSWGERAITLPILGVTLLALAHILNGAPFPLIILLGLFWFTYLFLINHTLRNLKWVFVIVLLGQSVVAILQFAWQRPLNLFWLGEVAMDLNTPGTSVLLHKGRNILRAYGLNSHPNQLGLLLVALLLMLWPYKAQFRHNFARTLFWLACTLGIAALVVSWSRSAWIALLVGTAVYLPAQLRNRHQWQRPSPQKIVTLLFLASILFIFLNSYSDILKGRLLLSLNILEINSLYERGRGTTLALQLIANAPLQGVGLGNYVAAGTQITPSAQIVHNVPLLIAAELGVLGFLLWIAFLAAPFFPKGAFSTYRAETAVWLALITISLVQPEPHLFLPKGALLWALAAAAYTVKTDRITRGELLTNA